MKRLSAAYSIAVLAGPLVIIAMLLAVPFGCGGGGGGGGAATPAATMGTVELGFVDSPTRLFQAIALNVIAVRLNPSTNPNVPDFDPNWVTIGVPSGAGATGEVSINLIDFQNDVTVFNTTMVPAQTYRQIEVETDPTFPGTVIPSCPPNAGPVEGCVDYALKFATGTSSNLRTSGKVIVTGNSVTPLIIDISPGKPVAPPATGGVYTLNNCPGSKTCPTLSVGTTTGLMARVSGTVSTALTGQTVTAELSGTSVVIATVPVTKGGYTMYLPAADTPLGTAYDLYVSGGGGSIDAFSRFLVNRSGGGSHNFNGVHANASSDAITGAVADHRLGNSGISAAAVILLMRTPNPTGPTCSLGAEGCVAVLSTTTDDQGNYTLSPVPSGTYSVEAQATGVASQSNPINLTTTSAKCTNSTNPSNCSFSLKSTTITGNVTIMPPEAGTSSTLVTVVAEQSGTGNLMGITSVVVPGTEIPNKETASAPFTIEVPPAGFFDLIASAQDSFLGVGTQFPGHKLGVFAKAGPKSTPSIDIECAGQGSITGVANKTAPDAGTLVRLFKGDKTGTPVQLMQSKVGPPTTVINGKPGQTNPTATQYSFCAPPDTYTVQRFEQPNATASPMAVGTPQPITVAAPAPTASPCPICATTAGRCPGNCVATEVASPL